MKLRHWLPFGKVPSISAEMLQAKLKHIQLIDVRTPTEFRASRINNAINLPITSFSATSIQALMLDKKIPIVTICLSAHRSIPATRRLLQLGYDVRQLEGGMKAWWASGYLTTNG